MSVFRLPDLGEGLQDAEIVAWHVSPGDHIVSDQPLVSVETDKAVVDIPSPQSGRITTLFGAPGDIVKVGAPLVEFDDAGVSAGDAIVGELPHEAVEPEAKTVRSAAPRTKNAIRAAPAARKLAREMSVELSEIAGTGPDGSITQADVRAFRPDRKSLPGGEPLRGPRRAMAQAMTRAGAEVVPATVTDEARIDHWQHDADITVFLIRAIIAGSSAEPALNAWYDPVVQQRKLHTSVDLGLALDTPDGLFVPVIRDAGAMGDAQLRAELERLKMAIAERTIARADIRGQTITLSNFGAIGGLHASLVILPPQVAILGAGRIHERLVPQSGGAVTARFIPLSLSFDHRVVTGGEAARFMRVVIAALEK